MRAKAGRVPGTWLIIGLVAVAIGTAAWMRATRVVVGAAAPMGAASAWPDMRIDVNAATPAELEVLPGLGPALAQRIVADRAAHGSFASIEDLARVPGIGERLVDRIRPYAVSGSDAD